MYTDTECTHYVWSGSEVVASIHWWCHQTTHFLLTWLLLESMRCFYYWKSAWSSHNNPQHEKHQDAMRVLPDAKIFPRYHLQLYAKHRALPLHSAAAAPATRVVACICQSCRFGCLCHPVVFAEEQAFLFRSKESSAIAKNILADQGKMSLPQELKSQNSTSWML